MGEETVKQETQTAEVEQKTFTQEEMNNIISERLGRERQKYADYDSLKQKADEFDKLQEANKTELEKALEKANSMEKKYHDLLKANEISTMRLNVSKETGVPIELLTAETEEECRTQAEKINAFAMPKSYPKVSDGGEVSGTIGRSARDQFAEVMNNFL